MQEQIQPKELQPKQQGIVNFDSDPHGAKIYVDGQLLINPNTEESLKTPARTLLYEGRHDFTISLEGHEDASGYVDVLPGVTVNIFKNLKTGKSEEGWGKPQPQIWLSKLSQSKPIGVIRAYSTPDGAEVYIDGRPAIDSIGKVVKTPATIYNVPAGVRQVSFRMPGQLEEMKLVDVMEGAWSDVSVTMRPIPPKLGKLDSYAYGFLDVEDFPNEDGKMFKML